MAKLDRKKQKIFGSTGDVAQFGQIGSDAAGSPTTTKDIDAIQSLGQYLSGLFAITANLAEPPRGQDINALYHLITRQLAYLFEAGIPEWEVATEYSNLSSFVSYNGDVYVSLSNANIGNTPAVGSAYWRKVVDKNRDAETVDGIDSTRMVYGDNAYASTLITDANAITKSGLYRCADTAANIPTASFYTVLHLGFDANACTQIAVGTSTLANMYARRKNGGTWQPWQKVWNTENDGSGSGLDADTVDSIDSTRIVFGSDSSATGLLTTVGSLNSLTKSGFYYSLDTANNPDGINNFYIVHIQYQTNYAVQMAFIGGISGNKTYTRQKHNGAWGAWVKVWNETNVGTNWPTALAAALGSGWATALAGTSQALVLNGATGPGDYILPGYGPKKMGLVNILAQNDESSIESGSILTYYKATLDPFKVGFSMTVRVNWVLAAIPSGATAYARIYVNSAAVGTEVSTTSQSWIPFYQDIPVSANDIVEVRVKTNIDGYSAYRSGFCLSGNGYGRKYSAYAM